MLRSRLTPLFFALIASTAARSAAQSNPSSASQPTPEVTLRATTQLVVVDVVVLDREHKPVHGLKQTDFIVSENNHPQTIKNFEIHQGTGDAPLPLPPKLPEGIFTNYTAVPDSAALNVILLDALNTPRQDQPYTRQQVLTFLKTDKGHNRFAIFTLNNRLNMLQSFTADPEVLRAALDSKRTQGTSPLLADASLPTADEMLDPSLVEASTLGPALADFEAQTAAEQTHLRTQYTLDAFNQIGRYLAELPGRKNLIWFSGSFPISILPDPDLTNPFSVVQDSEAEFRQMTSLLSRARVSVFPVDGRGLQTTPTFDASQPGGRYSTPATFSKSIATFGQDNASEHSTMDEMARETGGKAFYNTNGLTKAVETATEYGANFYTLTYSSTDPTNDGRFRRIGVKVEHSGYTLEYRHGYYADDPNSPGLLGQHSRKSAKTQAVPPETSRVHLVRSMMQRGSPGITQIIFKARVLPVAGVADRPADGNTPSPKIHGPWQTFRIDVAADPHAIQLVNAGADRFHADVELIALVYDRDGALVNAVTREVNATTSRTRYTEIVKGGFPLAVELSAPAKGEYSIRIGVHDLNSDRVGSTEIAVSRLRSLPALTAAPQPEKPVSGLELRKHPPEPAASPRTTPASPVSPAANAVPAPAAPAQPQ